MDLNEAKKILKENGIICEDDGKDWASITSSKIAGIDAIEYTWSETKGNHFIQFNHRIGDPTTLGVFYRPNESREGSVRIFKADNGNDKLFKPENSTPDEVAKAVKKAKLEAADQYIIRFAVEDTNSEKVKTAIYKFVTEFAKQVDSWDFGGIKHKFKPVSYKEKDDEYIFIRCAVNDIYGNIEELDKFWNRNIKTMEKAGVYTMDATFRETDFDNYKPFEEEQNESAKVKNFKGEKTMNLNEAKQFLNDNGYALDEGIGKFVKKARRAVFGKNKDDEDILAKRKARLQDNEETRKDNAKKAESAVEYWDNESYDVLRAIKRTIDKYDNWGEDSEQRGVYNALVALKKKWNKNIAFSFDSDLGFGDAHWVVHVFGVSIKNIKDQAWGAIGYGKDDNGKTKFVRRSTTNKDVCDLTYKLGSVGVFAGSNRVSRDNTNNKYKLKYATGLETRKMTETDNIEEWASKVNGLMREYIQGVKADDVDEWEQNIDQNESVKVKQALAILKENGYTVKR